MFSWKVGEIHLKVTCRFSLRETKTVQRRWFFEPLKKKPNPHAPMTLHREAGHIIHDYNKFIPWWGQILYRIHGWQKTTFTNIPHLLLQILLGGQIPTVSLVGSLHDLGVFCCLRFVTHPIVSSCSASFEASKLSCGPPKSQHDIFVSPKCFGNFCNPNKNWGLRFGDLNIKNHRSKEFPGAWFWVVFRLLDRTNHLGNHMLFVGKTHLPNCRWISKREK